MWVEFARQAHAISVIYGTSIPSFSGIVRAFFTISCVFLSTWFWIVRMYFCLMPFVKIVKRTAFFFSVADVSALLLLPLFAAALLAFVCVCVVVIVAFVAAALVRCVRTLS